MRALQGLLGVLATVILLALGGVLVALPFRTIWLQRVNLLPIWLETYRTAIGLVGAGVLCVAVGNIALACRQLRPERTYRFFNPQGEVRVSLEAIEDHVRRVGAQMQDVRELKPKIVPTSRGLEIYNDVVLQPNVPIPEATLRIQELVQKDLREALGIEDLAAVKVMVSQLVYDESTGPLSTPPIG